MRLLLICLSLSLQVSITAQKTYLFSYFKGNGEDGLHLAYSLDGYNFKALNDDKSCLRPDVGISKLMRDPCIIQTPDKKFHIVWTAGWTERGIGYASSNDLIKWSEQKYIMVMDKAPDARNSWAPEIFYDRKDKQFLIFWATTIPGIFPESQAKSENAYNHRIWLTTTRDFLSFTETKLFYEKGFNVIDATINRDKGQYIMFLKDETVEPPQKNIRIAYSESVYGPWSAPTPPITGNYWAEGPTAIKIKDSWIVYFDKYRDRKMGAVISSDLKNWVDISEKVSFPEGARHGTILSVSKKILDRLLKEYGK